MESSNSIRLPFKGYCGRHKDFFLCVSHCIVCFFVREKLDPMSFNVLLHVVSLNKSPERRFVCCVTLRTSCKKEFAILTLDSRDTCGACHQYGSSCVCINCLGQRGFYRIPHISRQAFHWDRFHPFLFLREDAFLPLPHQS